MNYTYTYNTFGDNANYSSSADAASLGLLAGLGVMVWIYCIIFIAIYVIEVIAMWKIFEKAGEEGWKSLIPIYNEVVLFKIAGLSPWLVLVYLCACIPFVGWIGALIMNILLYINLSKSFGKSDGFAVGLFFLQPIFYMILGFDSSKYVGKKYGQTQNNYNYNSNQQNGYYGNAQQSSNQNINNNIQNQYSQTNNNDVYFNQNTDTNTNSNRYNTNNYNNQNKKD